MNNQRLKALLEEVGFVGYCNAAGFVHIPVPAFINRMDRFAELIVQECRREWVGLTAHELKEINDRFNLKGPNIPVAFRTVESKLREKNEQPN